MIEHRQLPNFLHACVLHGSFFRITQYGRHADLAGSLNKSSASGGVPSSGQAKTSITLESVLLGHWELVHLQVALNCATKVRDEFREEGRGLRWPMVVWYSDAIWFQTPQFQSSVKSRHYHLCTVPYSILCSSTRQQK